MPDRTRGARIMATACAASCQPSAVRHAGRRPRQRPLGRLAAAGRRLPSGDGSTRTRAIRRPSSSTTVERCAVDARPRRRRSGRRPSAADDEAGDGLVRAVGQLEAGLVLEVVEVEQPVDLDVAAGQRARRLGSSTSYSSWMSPTSSSTRSSSVTMPAVPPYSSTTIARWWPSRRMSVRADSTLLGARAASGRRGRARRPAPSGRRAPGRTGRARARSRRRRRPSRRSPGSASAAARRRTAAAL